MIFLSVFFEILMKTRVNGLSHMLRAVVFKINNEGAPVTNHFTNSCTANMSVKVNYVLCVLCTHCVCCLFTLHLFVSFLVSLISHPCCKDPGNKCKSQKNGEILFRVNSERISFYQNYML